MEYSGPPRRFLSRSHSESLRLSLSLLHYSSLCIDRIFLKGASAGQGRSVLRSVTCDLGFPRAEMSESIRDNPNRRLSHAGVAIGDFALDPRPSSRGRQAVRLGDGVALLDLGDGRRRQLLPANA